MSKFFTIILALFITFFSFAEVLIESKFDKSTNSWYALKNYGVIKLDKTSAALQFFTNSKGQGRIANWKRITQKMCAGKVIKLTAKVRGTGQITPVFVMTVKSSSGGKSYPRFAGKSLQLKENTFVTINYSLDLSNRSLISIEPRLELKGENAKAYVSYIKCETESLEKCKIESKYSYVAFPEGTKEASFKVYSEPKVELQIFKHGNCSKITADSKGLAIIPIKDNALVSYTVTAKGNSINLFSEGINKLEFSALVNAAENCKLKSNSKILILGDSLSDFDRGRNYVDQLNFYLNFFGKNKNLTFYNFGIGGDDVKRVTRRLIHYFNKNTPDEYFQKRYLKINDVKYDYIFIFLGQNDTKASSKSNYKTTFVTPEEQLKSYRALLPELKKRFANAKIVLVSPIHTDSKRQDAIAKVILQRKPNVWKFGIREHIEKYNNMIKTLSKEYSTLYIDLYTPSKNHPDRSILFKKADGVHLSNVGERFVAYQIMAGLK